MATGWGDRIGRALLIYSGAVGQRVGQEELGRLVAEIERRESPYSKASVSAWMAEKSEPGIATFEAMATLFGCDPWWLVWGVGHPPTNVLVERLVPVPRSSSQSQRKAKGE